MKNYFKLLLLVSALLVTISCTSENTKAKWITEAYIKALYTGDYKKAEAYSTAETAANIEMFATMAAETIEDVEKIKNSTIEVSFGEIKMDAKKEIAIVEVYIKGIEGAFNIPEHASQIIKLKRNLKIDRWRVSVMDTDISLTGKETDTEIERNAN